jgi:hypothetical protein
MLAPHPVMTGRRKTFRSGTTVGSDAYTALGLVYELFGQPRSAIPFMVDGEVSERAILQM